MQKKKALFSLIRFAHYFFFILLAGCETTPGIIDESDFSSRTIGKCSETVELSGRVSMNYTLSHNDKTESLHGKFAWKQKNDKTHISLFSPLGQTMAIIDILPGQAIFTASGKPPLSASSADELIFQQLGWPLPVSGMRSWLQGCAIDANGRHFQATPSHMETTTRDGWHIRYIGWTPSGENEWLPRRIDMTHTPSIDAAISNIQIRLIIDEWHTEN
ncbi:MAG: lipoprotein insertase outer membrane protein LolB [Betaproteobacteria bacterium]|nr:lipoprotein insertase outer membrane protein LolB [Betaproteobacteria bacterium]